MKRLLFTLCLLLTLGGLYTPPPADAQVVIALGRHRHHRHYHHRHYHHHYYGHRR